MAIAKSNSKYLRNMQGFNANLTHTHMYYTKIVTPYLRMIKEAIIL